MKLLEVRVDRLFGQFDHVIPINNHERITILTAPNGYGKTIVLRIIDAIFNRRFNFLLKLDFRSIALKLTEGLLTISRNVGPESLEISIQYRKESGEILRGSYGPASRDPTQLAYMKNSLMRLPWIEQIGPDEWLDLRENLVLDFEEAWDRHRETRKSSQIELFELVSSEDNGLEWLEEIVGAISIHFVRDQRLIQRTPIQKGPKRSVQTLDTIEEFAQDLSRRIQKVSIQSSEQSQKLDSTFPSRLLSPTPTSQLTIEQLEKNLKELGEKQIKLSEHGLVVRKSQSLISLPAIAENDIRVLSLYVQDSVAKLSVYDELLKRLELFTEILNDKRLAFKRIVVSRDQGFYFESNDQKRIELTQLSSGEQHEIVLLYELIFRANENVIVLIDEPEISLHVAWQRQFLTDLRRIIDLQNLTTIIATHSPHIIQSSWDLTVNLGEDLE